eukprot:365819-Chlamydomonas_euryale.AAC.6
MAYQRPHQDICAAPQTAASSPCKDPAGPSPSPCSPLSRDNARCAPQGELAGHVWGERSHAATG